MLNLLDTGPDLLLRTDGAARRRRARARWRRFAAAHGIPRIAWARRRRARPEVAAQHGPAAIRFGGAEVHPPPGAFLQASPAGEAAIRDAVLDGAARTAAGAGRDRGAPRRDRHLELRPRGARARRRLRGVGGGGRRPGRGGGTGGRADRGGAARPRPAAAPAGGAEGLRRGGARPALRRRAGAGALAGARARAAHHLRVLQPGRAGARCEGAARRPATACCPRCRWTSSCGRRTWSPWSPFRCDNGAGAAYPAQRNRKAAPTMPMERRSLAARRGGDAGRTGAYPPGARGARRLAARGARSRRPGFYRFKVGGLRRHRRAGRRGPPAEPAADRRPQRRAVRGRGGAPRCAAADDALARTPSTVTVLRHRARPGAVRHRQRPQELAPGTGDCWPRTCGRPGFDPRGRDAWSVMTHFHADHIGGLRAHDGNAVPSRTRKSRCRRAGVGLLDRRGRGEPRARRARRPGFANARRRFAPYANRSAAASGDGAEVAPGIRAIDDPRPQPGPHHLPGRRRQATQLPGASATSSSRPELYLAQSRLAPRRRPGSADGRGDAQAPIRSRCGRAGALHRLPLALPVERLRRRGGGRLPAGAGDWSGRFEAAGGRRPVERRGACAVRRGSSRRSRSGPSRSGW